MRKQDILVLEENSAMRHDLTIVLAHAGYSVTATGSVTAAVAHLFRQGSSVVVMDLGVEGFSCMRFFRLLARHLIPPFPEVILFSEASESELTRRAESLGVDRWLRKGCTQRTFLQAVHEAAYQRQLSPRWDMSAAADSMPPMGLRIPQPLEV